MSDTALPETDAAALLDRLRADDPHAPAVLYRLLMPMLVAHLTTNFPRTDPHEIESVAAGVVWFLIENPDRYHPAEGDLGYWLRLVAWRKLANRVRSLRRHTVGKSSLDAVEHSPDGGKYLGVTDDPIDELVAEEEAVAARDYCDRVARTLDEPGRITLRLLLEERTDTAAHAEALGIADRPVEVQKRETKRHKDRVKKRLERAAGGADGRHA